MGIYRELFERTSKEPVRSLPPAQTGTVVPAYWVGTGGGESSLEQGIYERRQRRALREHQKQSQQ